MFWADRIAKEIADLTPRDGKKFVIRDEKTMSGRVHIGSMRGVAIHGLVSEILTAKGIANEYQYELNDIDPFDTVPGYLDEAVFREHLGKPLYAVPSPEPGFDSYAEYFAAEFVSVHEKAGFKPTYYRATELYRSGAMDKYIRIALTRAADVRRIMKEVSGSTKDDSWLPISVICETCGKVMTTRAYDFDGETVGYTCDKGPDGSVPCGAKGRVAPWKGAAKLFWKVDWAAKWAARGVDIEGAGKDHSTKGGARDVSNHIAKELFDLPSPYDIPYEFFLVGGKKMSSSKGRGSSAKEMSELFPPTVFRLVMLGKDINQQIDIDPSGDSVPRTFDWYDDLADGVRDGKADDFARIYAVSQLPGTGYAAPWQLRFSQVAFIVQMPHLSLEAEAERVKESPLTEEEKRVLGERAAYARFWLSTYAPDSHKYVLQNTVPEGLTFSDEQKKALSALADFMQTPHTGEEVQAKLFELRNEVPIEPKALFSAIYRIFLNRDSGPKAGWFLSVLPPEMVSARLKEASA
ncbi:MAG: lysine--tRNA ligase [Candidatus Pacebacteria bacterium]|nr:lysine--tRNA ligase [Candidatus Paceibacterota bacterium]MBP9840598.1 lysine--tRNA ligase [Candidatus Paceibacterota bacterium]